MPTMNQTVNWNEYDQQTAQNEIKTEFSEGKRQIQNKFDDYDNKIKTDAKNAKIHVAGMSIRNDRKLKKEKPKSSKK